MNLWLSKEELVSPWNDPFISPGQSLTQNGVTIAGAAVSSGVGLAIGALTVKLLTGSGWWVAGPVGAVALVAGGVAVAVTWEYAVKPSISGIANYFELSDPYQRYRRLEPRGNS